MSRVHKKLMQEESPKIELILPDAQSSNSEKPEANKPKKQRVLKPLEFHDPVKEVIVEVDPVAPVIAIEKKKPTGDRILGKKKKVVPPPFLHSSKKRSPFQLVILVLSMLITVFFGLRLMKTKEAPVQSPVEVNVPPPAEDPMKPIIAMNREAIGQFQNQKYEAALDLFKKVAAQRPQISSVYTNLGMTYLRLGNFAEAKKHLLNAVKLSPSDVIAYNDLGVMSIKEGDYASAIRYFAKAIEVSPSFPDGHLNLGKAFEQIGKPAQAMQQYQTYLSLSTADPVIKKMLEKRISKLGQISRYYEEKTEETE